VTTTARTHFDSVTWYRVSLAGPTVLGDLDGNGVVNGADLAIVLGHWGTGG